MHRTVMAAVLLRARARGEQGAVALMTALLMLSMLVACAFALDFGIVRVDRQVNQSAADAAALAGAESLAADTTDSYPFRGVCGAVRFLQQNAARYASLSDTSGTWSKVSGTTTANGCTDTTLRKLVCLPTDNTTWAKYTWSGTWDGKPITVTIQSGYRLNDAAAADWPEESLPAVAADNADTTQGCDQLSVIVRQTRKPGIGRLVTTSDVTTNIRAVARTKAGPGRDAPALLLLKRTGCPILSTGSNSGGSFIHVKGSVSSAGRTQAGTIHADTDGSACGTSIFNGRAPNGIVAYAAPKSLTDPSADPSKPGIITSVAGTDPTKPDSTIRDGAANVYGSSAVDDLAAGPVKSPPAGRGQVTRSPVDDRYLSGVTTAMSQAQTAVFGALTTTTAATTAGYTVVSNCNPSGTITATKVYIDCTDNAGYKGTAVINADTVVFNGKVNPSGTVSLPIATHVYVFGSSSNAIEIGNGTAFSMHTDGTTVSGSCSNTTIAGKAVLFVKDGQFKQTGGLLRLCNTTVMMMGGQGNGCVPATSGTAPTQTPCPSSSMGSGQLSQTGGDVDWTAPNQRDLMTLPSGDPDPTYAPLWSSVDGPEDLAFWSESAGNTSSTTYNMTGGGTFHVRGVYMVPNADSFIIGGGGAMTLKNAQYIATSIALNGNNTNITMDVDPNAAVVLKKKRLVGLVR